MCASPSSSSSGWRISAGARSSLPGLLNVFPQSERSPGKHRKPAAEFFSVLIDCGGRQLGLLVGCESFQSNEQHARMKQVLTKNEFSEILVRRHQKRLGVSALREHHLVVNTRIEFGNIQDSVSFGPEAYRQFACRRFRPPGSSPRHRIDDIRTKHLSGKTQGRPNSFSRQPWMFG